MQTRRIIAALVSFILLISVSMDANAANKIKVINPSTFDDSLRIIQIKGRLNEIQQIDINEL